jgi:hypothetical protein|tara:strand:- start:1325 stop:1582 length:258 start_codon:yes stop_codon:yes gene_type:complete
MDKLSILSQIYEEHIFDDTIMLMISVDDGELEVTPMGGTFSEHDIVIGQEAYDLSRILLEAADKYGGMERTSTGGFTFMNPKEKH